MNDYSHGSVDDDVVCMSVFVLQGIFHDLGSMCEGKYRPAMW